MNFDGLTFLTALVMYSQSDYLNYYNNDYDWPIVACFMRVERMLDLKFILKIESNAQGI